MVCAAVAARISPRCTEKTCRVKLTTLVTSSVDLYVVTDLIETASEGLPGVLVAERGDLFNIERWKAESILGREFKYPESLGERRAIELAHHISFAARKMMLELEEWPGMDKNERL